MITSITIKKPSPKRIKSDKDLTFVVEYSSTTKDTTGLGGTWQGGGSLLDVYKIGPYYVWMNVLNHKPFVVCKSDVHTLVSMLEGMYNVKVEVE